MQEYREVQHLGCECLVNRDGDVFTKNYGGDYVHRTWHQNADGYAVVSAAVLSDMSKKQYRSLQVHILVAKAFVPNPDNKPEVNHKDFNRWNPCADNLEWMTHAENIRYSAVCGRKSNIRGSRNPNYGNRKLSSKYAVDKELATAKQSRKGKQNGRAKPCRLFDSAGNLVGEFAYRRAAVNHLIERGLAQLTCDKEYIIKRLTHKDYKGYYLTDAS